MKLNRFIKFMIKQRDRYRQQFRINPEQVDVGFVIKRPDATEFVFLDPDKTESGEEQIEQEVIESKLNFISLAHFSTSISAEEQELLDKTPPEAADVSNLPVIPIRVGSVWEEIATHERCMIYGIFYQNIYYHALNPQSDLNGNLVINEFLKCFAEVTEPQA